MTLGVRLLLESTPFWGVIQVDVKNAFNTIHRRAIFEEMRDARGGLEGLLPFVRSFYGGATPLFFSTSWLVTRVEWWAEGSMVEGGRSAGQSGDIGVAGVIGAEAFEEVLVELESATGTRQGDPLGGVLFALGHQQALRATAAAFPDCAFPSIADDTRIVGPPQGWLRHLLILLCG